MRIALVGPGILPIPPNGYGAVEKHIDYLARKMLKRGHEVTVLNELVGEYAWAVRVKKLLKPGDFDVIHAHTSFMGGFLAKFGDFDHFVYTSHSPLWLLASRGPIERWGMVWERLAIVEAEAVIALTSGLADVFHEFRHTTWVVPNGVDCGLYFPRDYSERNGKKVCMLGKVVPRKRMHVVARALRDSAAELHIIGPMPDQGYTKEIKRIKPSVVFHGLVPERELALILSEMDVFVHASEAEAMSLAILEAMASGLPVVHSLSSCAFDVVGKAGIRVDADDDPDAYAQAIERLLADDWLRGYFGRAARDTALSAYSWERVADRVEEVYAAVADVPP